MNAPASILRVLIVKTSSMGDIVHALPVVHDILAAHPGAQIDWLVEEAYADIVRAHPGVRRVVPLALRRWRKRFWRAEIRREWRQFRAQLRTETYDAVIDLQGLLKSAVVARQARGPVSGWGWGSARESMAVPFYRHRYSGAPMRSVPAVERCRQLAARVLGYVAHGSPVYGLRVPAEVHSPKELAAPYVVVLTATARPEKRWRPQDWVDTAQSMVASGRTVLFAWGTQAERQAAQAIVEQAALPAHSAVVQPEAWTLLQWLPILARADAVIGVDTGLLFLAAALDTPCVGIYVATSPVHVGIHSAGPHRNLGDVGSPPDAATVVAAVATVARTR